MSLVSVIVVARNDRAFVRDCLDSLLEQEPPVHEVIVADCGSTDGTDEIVAAVAGVTGVFGDATTAVQRATGDIVYLAGARTRFAPDAVRSWLDGPPDATPSPIGVSNFGRAVAGVWAWLPLPDDAPGGGAWQFVADRPAELAEACRRAVTGRRRTAAVAAPALLVGAALAGAGIGKGWRRLAVPVFHAAACAALAARASRDAGVAPHRALLALEIGHWSTGVAAWLPARARTKAAP